MVAGKESFREELRVVTDGGILFVKYKSIKSGLTVAIAQSGGPILSGYFVIPTEAHDHDGLPHTLEHLVFLGSESYPYKGVLDLISNRSLANGTNAWTDTDHTCYYMMTAGFEGFLNLLPVFAEHLMYPTLSDSAFTTEVHHINGEGEDSGVVYCEMQGRENSMEDLCYNEMLQAMYPGHCGYKSETGGKTLNLRESTSNVKVRNYHKTFYRPENMSIIIVGQIDSDAVFDSLAALEDRMLQDIPRESYVRPWQSIVPPLTESTVVPISYPCDDEDFGNVIISWRGPESRDYLGGVYLGMLFTYMTSTSISPLKKEFETGENPICSSVTYSIIENAVSCLYLTFENVPIKEIENIKPRLFKVLENICDKTEPIDMERMRTVIRKTKLQTLSNLESAPVRYFSNHLIGDALYGNTVKDLEQRLQNIPVYESLLEKNAEFWIDILKKNTIDGNYVCVLGSPSSSLARKMEAEEKERIAKQRERLGTEGLKEKADALAKAIETNEVPPPDSLIKSFKLPSTDSVKLHSIQRFNNDTDNKFGLDLGQIPCRFQVDHIQSNFVRLYILLDTVDVPQHLRMYLPLFVELLDQCAIKRDGVFIPHEEVIKELSSDTVSKEISLGFSSRFFCREYSQIVSISIMVEEEKYSKGIQWLKELLFDIIFERETIKDRANKMVTDIAGIRREGRSIVQVLNNNLVFRENCNRWCSSVMRQHSFLTQVLKSLENEAQLQEVLSSLNEVRSIVTRQENITVHLGANISNLQLQTKIGCPWRSMFFPQIESPVIPRRPTQLDFNFLREFSSDSKRCAIIGLASVDASSFLLSAPCITSYNHEDYATLLVLIQYLDQCEGPLWKELRGPGLTYSSALFLRPNEGLIHFALFSCLQLMKAYQVTEKLVNSYLSGETKWDPLLLESGCSSLMFNIINQESTLSAIVRQSMTAYYKNTDTDFTRKLLEKIAKVTFTDMERACKQYLKPLFNPETSICAVCCPSSKVEEIVEAFKGIPRELEVLPSLETPFLSKY